MFEGSMGRIYQITEWIMRIAFLNLIWIIFSLMGLVILGFFPATIAMFAVARKWTMKNPDIPLLKTFWEYYKSEFVKGNMFGLAITMAGLLLYFNIKFLNSASFTFAGLFFTINLIIAFLFLVTVLYAFPVYVHFDINIFPIFKNAFLLGVTQPSYTLSLVALTYFYYRFMLLIPGLIPFFSGSTFAFLTIMICNRIFVKINFHK